MKKIVKRLFTGYNVVRRGLVKPTAGELRTLPVMILHSTVSVIHRSVPDIFKYIADHSELSFRVGVSFMELYNEQIFDLLSLKSRREETIIDIQEDGNKGIKIPGLRLTFLPWTTHWASWRRPVKVGSPQPLQ